MPGASLKPLAELFLARLLKLLVKERVIDDSFVAMLMKWKHTSGFNVDNSVRIARGDEKGITALAQHILEKSFQLVRYYGWYSNRMRGERGKVENKYCTADQEKKTVDISKLMIDGE